MDFQTSSRPSRATARSTRFTALLGVNADDKQRQRDARRRVVQRATRCMLAGPRLLQNGWFDKGSDAGGVHSDAGLFAGVRGLGVGNVTAAVCRRRLPSTRSSRRTPRNTRATRRARLCRGQQRGRQSRLHDCTGPRPLQARLTATRRRSISIPTAAPFVLAGAHGYNGPIRTRATPVRPDRHGLRRRAPAAERQPRPGRRADGYARSPQERRSLFGRATHEHQRQPDRVRAGELRELRGHDDRRLSRPRSRSGRRRSRRTASAISGRAADAARFAHEGRRRRNGQRGQRSLDAVPRARLPRRREHGRDERTRIRSWPASTALQQPRLDLGSVRFKRARRSVDNVLRRHAVAAALPVCSTRSRAAELGPERHLGYRPFTAGRNYAQTCTSGLPIFTDSSNVAAGNCRRLHREHRGEDRSLRRSSRTSPSSTCRARSPT